VVAVDVSKNAILIKGAIPGANRSVVTIRTAVKAQRKQPVAKTLVSYASK
jgi:large subunit ribosomal protein L3